MNLTTNQSIHKVLPGLIRSANSQEMEILAVVIKTVEITQNHDVILTAWRERCAELRWGSQDLGVPKRLIECKEAMEQYDQGFQDGLHGRDCKPISRFYITGFEEGLKAKQIGMNRPH